MRNLDESPMWNRIRAAFGGAPSNEPPQRELVRLPPPPPTRAGCADLPRPCGRSCRYNLGIRIRQYDPDRDGCALDFAESVAAQGRTAGPQEVARAMGVVKQTVDLAQRSALTKLRAAGIEVKPSDFPVGPTAAEPVSEYADDDWTAFHRAVKRYRIPDGVSFSTRDSDAVYAARRRSRRAG